MNIFTIHSSADGHGECFYFLDNVDDATVGTDFWICLFDMELRFKV